MACIVISVPYDFIIDIFDFGEQRAVKRSAKNSQRPTSTTNLCCRSRYRRFKGNKCTANSIKIMANRRIQSSIHSQRNVCYYLLFCVCVRVCHGSRLASMYFISSAVTSNNRLCAMLSTALAEIGPTVRAGTQKMRRGGNVARAKHSMRFSNHQSI